MEKVYFAKSKKDDGVVCRTEGGKFSFVDKSYKGVMPKEGEQWIVEIAKKMEKVNIVRPLFKIDKTTSLEDLLKTGDFYLRLDFFSGELVVYERSFREDKEFSRLPYDGRWDDKKFFNSYSFPEAIRLHKLSKEIVEAGKTAVLLDSDGKLIRLPPSSVDRNFHEYGYYCHIHTVDGEENLDGCDFVNEETELKFEEFRNKTKEDFFANFNSPLPEHYRNIGIVRSIGIPEFEVRVSAPQKLLGSSCWNASYHEVVAASKMFTYLNRPIEGESACQVCGSTDKSLDFNFTTYYEKAGGGYFDRDIGSAHHKGIGKCPECGAVQYKWWGKEEVEITDLPNFPDLDGQGAKWENQPDEEYSFPYEDNFIKGKIVITVSPKIGKSYLQTYKVWHIKSYIFYVEEVKEKCFLSKITIETEKRGETNKEQRAEVDYFSASFPENFSLPERYICGWLPAEYYYQEKVGAYTQEEIHDAIAGYLADCGEYFAQDIPNSAKEARDILLAMVANGYLKTLPSSEEINSLYPLFQEDWVEFSEGPEGFPSEEEWVE